MTEKWVSCRTHGISLSKALKAGKSRPKCLSSDFSKESLGYWSNPDGKEFFSNFSLNVTMENQNIQDGHQMDDERNDDNNDDNNSTLTVENQNDDIQEDLPLDSGQNSVVSEVSLDATETENFDSLLKQCKVLQSKP